MKILIADKLSSRALSALAEAGLATDFRPELSADDLPDAVPGYNVLVVRSTKVSGKAVAAGDSLSLIVRAGAGVNTIDVEATSARGIYVTNCPGRNSDAVAELAIGLLIACDRRIADATADLRSGHWNKKEFGKAQGLRGRTLGILGTGMIGRAVASLGQALGMKIVAWSPSLTAERAEDLGVQWAESKADVARLSDAVSIHIAAKPATQHFVDAEFLSAMPDGAILINTSRGNLIDTNALKDAIATKQLRVGLDVFEDEPSSGVAQFTDTAFASSVTCTPHIGASTNQAAEAIAAEVVNIITAFRETGRPLNVVNVNSRSSGAFSLVVRHYNRIGVLAGVLDALREEKINVEEMENAIFAGELAACCTLQLDEAPSEQLVKHLAGLSHVIQVHLEPR
jgi:D-3-phosphoglycerate dehydrogenase